jgi:membrane protein
MNKLLQVHIPLKNAFKLLSSHNPIILSASTAFFTTFALAPILIILADLLTLFFRNETILNRLFTKLASTIGQKPARDIHAIVNNFLSLEKDVWITIAISVFFYFVATTLLGAIRQAIHLIWKLQKKSNRKLMYSVKERLIEISMILLIGVLFLISLGMDSALASLNNRLQSILPGASSAIIYMLNSLLSVVVSAIWFVLVFKLLPEAKVDWLMASLGGLLTGLLFNLGKFFLHKILIPANVTAIFGPSGSLAILLLFIFYCSFILYYGAAFTFEYSKLMKRSIQPGKYAREYKREVIAEGT